MAKHYAIADIHGMYDIYRQVCDMLEPDDVVYFLGDAGDRGYANWQTIKDIYNNPQWVYLKGNHEDLAVKGLREITREDLGSWDNDFDVWMYNGGRSTYHGWCSDGSDKAWIGRLNRLPLTAKYTNPQGITFHMSHAGYTCGRKDEMWGDELLWSREHFLDTWDEENYKNDISIHGHTPIEYLVEQLQWNRNIAPYNAPEARSYCFGHKICIDNGVFYTGCTVLYNLDEMRPILLYDQSKKEDDDGTWQ